MKELYFLKLGGSLITDKTEVEEVRWEVLHQIVEQVQNALKTRPSMNLVIGHGSGSFGHIPGAKYKTREGVFTNEQWLGFAEVSSAASRLNNIVRNALFEAGIPVLAIQPSASTICHNGKIIQLSTGPLEKSLEKGLVPLVYGDVAFDEIRGGTIISTEEVFGYVAKKLKPNWLLLAGETDGVIDLTGGVIPLITNRNLAHMEKILGGSRGTDVTGGMSSKVHSMVQLSEKLPQMKIRIFNGLHNGEILRVLTNPESESGTLITSQLADH